MDTIVGRVVDGIEELGLTNETLILFYSDNGTNKSVTSHLNGKLVKGGKAEPIQSGIRVPLIASWPGQIQPEVTSQLVEPSDFLPTLAELAGERVPPNWQHDGVSFAPAIHKHPGARPRDWAFFWYDPRPGWDKMAFSRAIFALDHKYKLFSDGRLFAIDGVDYKEELLDPAKLSLRSENCQSEARKSNRQNDAASLSPKEHKSRSTPSEIPSQKNEIPSLFVCNLPPLGGCGKAEPCS